MSNIRVEKVVVKSFKKDSPENMFGFGKADSGGDVFLHYGNGSFMTRFCNKIYITGENEILDPISKEQIRLRVPREGDELICGLAPSSKGAPWKALWWGQVNALNRLKEEVVQNPPKTYRLLRKTGHTDEVNKKEPEILWEGVNVIEVCTQYPLKWRWTKGVMTVIDDPLRNFDHADGISVEYLFEKKDALSEAWLPCSDVRHFNGAKSIMENLDSMLAVLELDIEG